jgi:hypothetical protein
MINHRLDFDGLINAVGELLLNHRELMNELCQLPLSDLPPIRLDVHVKGGNRFSMTVSQETADDSYSPRKRPNRAYQDISEKLSDKKVPNRPGRPAIRDTRPVSALSDKEHGVLLHILNLLERHEDAYLFYLKGTHNKSKAPTPTPLYSSIRTKTRRKRYKCLQDYIDHVALLWESLGGISESIRNEFYDHLHHYFPKIDQTFNDEALLTPTDSESSGKII